MKKIVLFLLTGAIIASCSQTSKTESGEIVPRKYHAYRTSGLVLDGRLDESDWKSSQPSELFVDISTDAIPQKETSVKMLWDDDNLYIGATIAEDKIVANLRQRDTIIWKENDFEVFIDPDGDGECYFEIEINAIGTVMDLMMNRPYRDGGNFYMPWDCPGLVVSTSSDDKGWYAELAIPRKSLMIGFAKPEELPFWRINFSRVEWMRSDREENWVWSPTGKVDMHMPELWGYVYFVDEPAASDM